MQAWLQQCLCMQMTNYRGVVFNGWEMGENRGKRGHERTTGRIAKVCTNACVHLNLQSRVLCIWPLLFYAASALTHISADGKHSQRSRRLPHASVSNPSVLCFQTIVSEFIIRWKFVLEWITATVCWTESPFGWNACVESSLMMPGLRPEWSGVQTRSSFSSAD